MPEIKVRYLTLDGDRSKAYVDENGGAAVDTYTGSVVWLALRHGEWYESDRRVSPVRLNLGE